MQHTDIESQSVVIDLCWLKVEVTHVRSEYGLEWLLF